MRPQPDKPQGIIIRLLVDQHKIGPDVAIAMTGPIARKRVVAVPISEGLVECQILQDSDHICIDCRAVPTSQFALEITPEFGRAFNRPH